MSFNNLILKQDTTNTTTGLKKILCRENAKRVSRRNPWGSQSYAELITQAIESSMEKRMTLSQIYEYIIRNVPYFHDKGDSKSSSGWKNSIRHNLSLHNRFQRIQTDEVETANRCSYWQINPAAGAHNTPRRRSSRTRRRNRTRIRHSMIYKSSQLLTNRASFHSLPHLRRENYSLFQEKIVNTPPFNTHVSMIATTKNFNVNAKPHSGFDVRNDGGSLINDLPYCSMDLNSHLIDRRIPQPLNDDQMQNILTNNTLSNVITFNNYCQHFQSNADLHSGKLCLVENQNNNKSFTESTENYASDGCLNESDLKLRYGSKLCLGGTGCFTSAHHLSGSFVTTNIAEYSKCSDSKTPMLDEFKYMSVSTNDPQPINFVEYSDNSDSINIVSDHSEYLNASINSSQQTIILEDRNPVSKTITVDDSRDFDLSSSECQPIEEIGEKENSVCTEVKFDHKKLYLGYLNHEYIEKTSLSKEINLQELFRVRSDPALITDVSHSPTECSSNANSGTSIIEQQELRRNSVPEIIDDQEENKIFILNKTAENDNFSGIENCNELGNSNSKTEVFWDQDFTLLSFEDAKTELPSIRETFSKADFLPPSVTKFTNKTVHDKFLLCDQEIEANLRKIWMENHHNAAVKNLITLPPNKNDSELTTRESFCKNELGKICVKNSNEIDTVIYELANNYDTRSFLCQETDFSIDSNAYDYESKVKNDDIIEHINASERDRKKRSYSNLFSNKISKSNNDNSNENNLPDTNSTINNSNEDVNMIDIRSINISTAVQDGSAENFVPESPIDASNDDIHYNDSETSDFLTVDSTERLNFQPVLGINQHDCYFISSLLEEVSTLNKLNFASENQHDDSFLTNEGIVRNDIQDFGMPEFEDLNEQPSYDTEWHLPDSVFPEINLRIDDINLNDTFDTQSYSTENMNTSEVSDNNILIEFADHFNGTDMNNNITEPSTSSGFIFANKDNIEFDSTLDRIKQDNFNLINLSSESSSITSCDKQFDFKEIGFPRKCNLLKTSKSVTEKIKYFNLPNETFGKININQISSIDRIVNNLRIKAEASTGSLLSSAQCDFPYYGNNDDFENVFSEIKFENLELMMEKNSPDNIEKNLLTSKRKDSGFSDNFEEKIIEVIENSDLDVCLDSISSEESNDTGVFDLDIVMDQDNNEIIEKYSSK